MITSNIFAMCMVVVSIRMSTDMRVFWMIQYKWKLLSLNLGVLPLLET